MTKKYFFFDIDGTLTDRSTGKIVPSALEALHKLCDEGHFVAIATGRAYYKCADFMKECGLHNMVCCGGGGLVVNDQLIRNIPLPLQDAKNLIHEAKENHIGYLAALDDSIDVYSENDLFCQQAGERKEATRYLYDEHFDVDSLDKIMKVYLSVSPEDEAKLPSLKIIGHLRFHPEYLICQYDEKKQGILDMIKAINGKLEDVVVFGDDTNDLVMFDKRWTSIAMGNATAVLKEKADYVTDRNVDDGIMNACLHFGWI